MPRFLMFPGTAAGLCALLQAQPNFAPNGPTVVLNTDFQVVQPASGAPYNVTGGVFLFHDVTIPAGTRVVGQGSRPLILILTGSLQLDGVLDVSGGDGQQVFTLHSANLPAAGGVGGPAAGHGGSGSPRTNWHSFAGETGSGGLGTPGFGGGGGVLSLFAGERGSGGGGGAFATIGDPHFKNLWLGGTSFVQQLGVGGFGGSGPSGALTRDLTGGGPGVSPFFDAEFDNDFFGFAYDVHRNRLVVGELTVPMGGGGGGGGGDRADSPTLGPNWASDRKAGGGGGGGGCVIVYSLESIVVGPTGSIVANGGNGGGGEQAASCNEAGGGGGGAGGMIVLAAQQTIDLHVKGETYANGDYDFVLSADGGICETGALPPVVAGKYPATGQPTFPGTHYDQHPLGGFGGMGIVQLATHPGSNADNTNTILDDNVRLFQNGALLTGATKTRYLAWRGFDNGAGVAVDDSGSPTNIGADEGDIRPAPVLMILP